MGPDEEALRRDLRSLAFKIGERRGKWLLKGVKFPHVLFFVAAAPRSGGPEGFLLRSDCAGYSATAPASQLWHGGLDTALEEKYRPKAGPQVMKAFQNWENRPCLYHPIDRLAREHWPNQYDELAWTPNKDITFLLETVHGLFHGSDYTGSDLPAEALNMPASFMEKHLERIAQARAG